MTPSAITARAAIRGTLTLFCCSALLSCSALKEKIASAIVNAAIDQIVGQGGVAVLVEPGQPFVLEFEDETSELFGSQVDLPEDALPIDVEAALLSIEPSDLSEDPDGQRRVGPPADIRLRRYLRDTESFEDESTITLRRPGRVRLPYDRSAVPTTAATSVVIGHLVNDASDLEFLSDTTVDTESGFVEGDTSTFSPFLAIINGGVLETAENRFNKFTGSCIENSDEDDDGTTDTVFESIFVNDLRTEYLSYPPGGRGGQNQTRDLYFYDATGELTGGTVGENPYSTSYLRGPSGAVTQENIDFFLDEVIDGRTLYARDSEGRVAFATNVASGEQIAYGRDARDRINQVAFNDSEGNLQDCNRYTYVNGALSTGVVRATCTDEGELFERVSYTNCPERIVRVIEGLPD